MSPDSPPLRFHSIQPQEGAVRGRRGHDGRPPRLLLATPTHRLREVPLTRVDLMTMAEQALAAVRDLDRRERVTPQ